ncbi:6790_t:CDS:2, partial [Cetraspora pellucida]
KANKPSDFNIKGNSKHITELLEWFTDVPVSIKNKDDKTVTATGNFTHIDNGEPEPMLCLGKGSKLGDIPSSQYSPSRIELENQLACANRDQEIAIKCDNKHIQHDLKQSNNDKEKLSKHTYQLINEKEILKKEFEIISFKSELTNTKKELVNIKNELALKINEIECLGALRSVLQKTKDILDSVRSKTYCSAIVKGGEKKNMQSKEQSFISNFRDTSKSRPEGSLLCRLFKGNSSSHKSFAKYFKSKPLSIITNNQNSELLIQDITNKQNPELLIQDITIKETSEGTNVPKLTMNKQSEVNYRKKEIFYPVYRNYRYGFPESSALNEANKHESIQNVGHPAMLWPFSKVFTNMSSKGKTNIIGNLVLGDKAENIYK